MNLFRRVLSRAGVPGGAPLARMKGLPQASRSPDPTGDEPLDDLEAQPLRRAPTRVGAGKDDAEGEAGSALRRARAPGEPDEDRAPPLRRTAEPDPDEDDRPLHRAPVASGSAMAEDPEEVAAPMRRVEGLQAAGDDLQPMRRAAAPDAPEDEPAQPLRRASAMPPTAAALQRTAPSAQMLDAETSPRPDLDEGETGPSPAMALRRLSPVSMPSTALPGQPAMEGPATGAEADPAWSGTPEPAIGAEAWTDPGYPVLSPPSPRTGGPDRPRVIIEQIDVVIHEPAPASAAVPDAAGIRRTLRSRYLQA